MCKNFNTVKSVSEALILESVNPQYDGRLFKKIASSEHLKNMCIQIVLNDKTKTKNNSANSWPSASNFKRFSRSLEHFFSHNRSKQFW